MAEIVVVVLFRAVAGGGADAEAAFAEVVPPTHAEEGCVVFAVHRVARDPDRFVLIERWASREALDEHLASPHLAAFRARGADIWAEPPGDHAGRGPSPGRAREGRPGRRLNAATPAASSGWVRPCSAQMAGRLSISNSIP